MLSFRSLSILSSGFALATFIILLAYPSLIYLMFGIEGGASADVMSRRAGVLFLSVGVILWRLRNLDEGSSGAGLAFGMLVFMTGFVILGLVEFALGNVGPGILVAVVTEGIIGGMYLKYAFLNR